MVESKSPTSRKKSDFCRCVVKKLDFAAFGKVELLTLSLFPHPALILFLALFVLPPLGHPPKPQH